MAHKLYKYAAPGLLPKILPEAGGAVFSCSYPKAFNDPYELFLSIDLNESPELLAFYADVVGELPQLPTTCFSRSPSVIPMWAHYAHHLAGFVIEVDETKLAARYPQSGFGNVDYRNTPDPQLNESLALAYHTCKPRHTYLLRGGVFQAAYYTKAECWAYEQERRIVASDTEVRTDGDLMLLDVPSEAITAVVCGPRANEGTRRELLDRSAHLACRYLDMRVGRTSVTPYFLDTANTAWVFREGCLVEADHRCEECGEPMLGEKMVCPLCSVKDAHLSDAARRNPYRLLRHHGMLAEYVQDMDRIRSQHRDASG